MRYVVGIDEAGRGPLAGPVAVGVVMVAEDFDWALMRGVRDSKQLSPGARERLHERACRLRDERLLSFAVCFSSARVIDAEGIVPAIQKALARALVKAGAAPETCDVRLDGSLAAPARFKTQSTIIRGDASEPAISLASIVAKVERDRLMGRYAKRFPAYGLDVHKGYGTARHIKLLSMHGLSPLHRRTFCARLRLPESRV